jgi:hypothetical protein
MPNHNDSRRIVLRGLFAAGCALCLPRLSEAQHDSRLSKERAQYQDHPEGDQKCGNCMHFVTPDACHIVEGTVKPEGWCKLWAKKPG